MRGVAEGLEPTFVPNWEDIEAEGVMQGNGAAKVRIVEFSDLECPFCMRFHATRTSLKRRYGDLVSSSFVHFPLPSHRFARPAARAAECAAVVGRFDGFIARVFEKQDSLGLKSWGSFARAAGIEDTARFVQCSQDTALVVRVERGRALGEALGLKGTPTVLVNGWRLPEPPDSVTLFAMAERILEGREPIASRRQQ